MVTEMRKMRTAEEMFAYYQEHKNPEKKKSLFTKNVSDDDRWRDLKLAEFILESDEYILSFFWAYIYIYIYDMSGNKDKRWIYILTNKRIIAICCDEYGMAEVDYTKLKNIIFIPDKTEIFFNIEGWYRGFSDVRADKENLEFTQREIEKVMPFIREIQEKEAQKKKFSGSPADEIRKFKQLCDDGIITEEEFEDRKRELLKFKYME